MNEWLNCDDVGLYQHYNGIFDPMGTPIAYNNNEASENTEVKKKKKKKKKSKAAAAAAAATAGADGKANGSHFLA